MINTPRNAIITGASTGIGRALATRLASQAWRIALLGRRREALNETARLVREAGGAPIVLVVDLADPNQILATTKQICQEMPSINLIANIAGAWHNEDVAYQGPLLHETPTEQVLEVLRVGAEAPLLLTSALLRNMIGVRDAHVMNISGTFSSGAKGWLHYFVSKKAIEAFTLGLAQELRSFEIQVNCVSPADVATEAYKRFYPQYAEAALQPDEVADFILRFMDPVNRHVSGQIIEIRNRSDHA